MACSHTPRERPIQARPCLLICQEADGHCSLELVVHVLKFNLRVNPLYEGYAMPHLWSVYAGGYYNGREQVLMAGTTVRYPALGETTISGYGHLQII
jgi:hypothetical protein